jgi:5'-deoxynucleotidase YfbR-like HD superfamily hydrolase
MKKKQLSETREWHGPTTMGMKTLPEIMTYTGRYFNFLEPSPDSFDIQDIAHALSMICRYTGHTKQFYSVAQHSVAVSFLVPPEWAMAGLLHDAAEAFIGDVSSPLKQLLPEYKLIEKRIEKVIFQKFGLPPELPKIIKVADVKLMATEQRDLMGAGAEDWAVTKGIEPLEEVIEPLSPTYAYSAFITRYRNIKGGRA